MFGIGTTELVLVLVLVLVLFGGKKIPEIGAGLGKGIRNFKAATQKKQIDDGPEAEKEDKEET